MPVCGKYMLESDHLKVTVAFAATLTANNKNDFLEETDCYKEWRVHGTEGFIPYSQPLSLKPNPACATLLAAELEGKSM